MSCRRAPPGWRHRLQVGGDVRVKSRGVVAGTPAANHSRLVDMSELDRSDVESRRSEPTTNTGVAVAQTPRITKHIFVTGGVASSLGKGLTASSLGRLLTSRGLRVTMQKLDPY